MIVRAARIQSALGAGRRWPTHCARVRSLLAAIDPDGANVVCRKVFGIKSRAGEQVATDTKAAPSPCQHPSRGALARRFKTLRAAAIVVVAAAAGCAGQSRLIPAGSMTIERERDTATLLSDGRVLIVGGDDGVGIVPAIAPAELYDPGTNTFSATGSTSTGRSRHMAALLADGRVLIAGGFGLFGSLTSAELYDPKIGTFTATGLMTVGRQNATGTLLADGRVLIAGGESGQNASLASAELYDPSTGTFTPTGSMTTARQYQTATLLGDGRVLIVGGQNDQVLASAELYDPKAGTFTATGSMLYPREDHSATLLSNGRVFIAGGGNKDWPEMSFTELYDPSAGTFGVGSEMNYARSFHTATLLSDGRVLIAGGFGKKPADTNTGAVLATAELFQP